MCADDRIVLFSSVGLYFVLLVVVWMLDVGYPVALISTGHWTNPAISNIPKLPMACVRNIPCVPLYPSTRDKVERAVDETHV